MQKSLHNRYVPHPKTISNSRLVTMKRDFRAFAFEKTGWWQLKYFLFLSLCGEDEPILTFAFFSDGLVKNHQPVVD